MSWKFWSRNERRDDDGVGDDGETRVRPPAFATIDARLRQRPAFLDALWRGPVEVDESPDLPRFSATASDDVASTGDEPELARKRLALRDALALSLETGALPLRRSRPGAGSGATTRFVIALNRSFVLSALATFLRHEPASAAACFATLGPSRALASSR